MTPKATLIQALTIYVRIKKKSERLIGRKYCFNIGNYVFKLKIDKVHIDSCPISAFLVIISQ